MNKLDPRLRYLFYESSQSPKSTASESLKVESDAVEVLVRCRVGESVLDELREVGMKVRFAIQSSYTVVSGEATRDTLRQLNELDIVEQVEASRLMVAELDRSCVETHAHSLKQSDPSVRGEGVIVGIIDSGIDYSHPSFRNKNGSSRILYLWDQSGQSYSDPNLPEYGRQYTQSELNVALASNTPFTFVPHQDTNGHGTHVAGIAVGNGTSNGNYKGIAPGADLIVVALALENQGIIDQVAGERMTLGQSVKAVEAFGYIINKAEGRPVVINFSQGMNSGGHCGETLLETALDAMVQQPSVVVVKSAGNEQERRIHAGGQIAQGSTVILELQVQRGTSDEAFLELWHDGTDQISIAVQPPGGLVSDFVSPSDQIIDEPRPIVFREAAPNDVSVNFDFNAGRTGDTCTTFRFSRGTDRFLQPGTWKLLLYGKSVQVGRYDVWIERASRKSDNFQQIQFTEASNDPIRTITVPGTARRIITVGSYVTRPHSSSSPQGQISSFSSRGSTRYGLQKPDIVAPGEVIISARSSVSASPSAPDNYHTLDYGTSMAAPHVTGAVALILSVRRLTCEQVKQVLMRTAQQDEFTSTEPDNIWGSGKLNVEAAIQCARTVQFPQISNVHMTGEMLSWQTDILTTSSIRFHTNWQLLTLGKHSCIPAATTPSRNHALILSELRSETYYYEIWVCSSDNWWTVDDNRGQFYMYTSKNL